MSRPKTHQKKTSMAFAPLEWAWVLYYGHRYRNPQADVVRKMITAYVESDKRFDADDFARFVRQDLAELLTDREHDELFEEMKARSLDYVKARKAADAPTLTLPKTPPSRS